MSLRPNSKVDARKQRYKVTVDALEARRKREENMVEIRKSKREENLLKKRREGVMSALQTQPSSDYNETISMEEKLQNLPATVSALASDDIQAKEAAAIQLRKMLSVESNPPIGAVILAGAVPLLVDILRRDDMSPQLQFEAAWSVTNLVSGTSEHTKVVIDYGAVPVLVELLTSVNDNVREQVVWALGNIAGDSAEYRDVVLSHGALMQVLAQFNENAKISMLRNATWALSNFCRGKPQPLLQQVKPALPALRCLIQMQDEDVLIDACWALSYISDGANLKIQAVIDAGICPKLVELVSHHSWTVVVPALRAVGNIVTGDDRQTQVVIDNQALPRILQIMTTEQKKKTILKEACWAISNITAGTKEQLQAVINANIIPPLLSLLANAEFMIKKEAAWAISNATAVGDDEQIKYLVSQGCIKPICDLLTCPDPRIITVCLEGLENILRAGETEIIAGLTDVNVYVRLIEDADGLDKIENLQSHENTQVYEKTVRILETYLADQDDDEIITTYAPPDSAFGFSSDQHPEVPPGGFNFM